VLWWLWIDVEESWGVIVEVVDMVVVSGVVEVSGSGDIPQG
jgi:hypothetical protein